MTRTTIMRTRVLDGNDDGGDSSSNDSGSDDDHDHDNRKDRTTLKSKFGGCGARTIGQASARVCTRGRSTPPNYADPMARAHTTRTHLRSCSRVHVPRQPAAVFSCSRARTCGAQRRRQSVARHRQPARAAVPRARLRKRYIRTKNKKNTEKCL